MKGDYMRKTYLAGLLLVLGVAFCAINPKPVTATELPQIVLLPSDPAAQAVPVVPIETLINMSAPAVPEVTVETVTSADSEESSGMTYVDVNIDNQILTYFSNGKPVLITPCVTGSPGRSTPKGVFTIDTCIPGKYLTGPTWHVWVDRWMRFCGGCGIHDATWRNQFGGDIYLRNGSHGCVNIPHDQAILLYSMVGVGTVVYVH